MQEASIFGPMEIGLLLLVCLLLFGAKRIPEIAGSFGKGIKEFKKSVSDVQTSIDAAPTNDVPAQSNLLPPAPMYTRQETTPEREPKRLI
jgi:sec-independent protein translocase protein TatA